ncbi:hypothetical protein GGD66_007911 [Bradyrhizobium sp. CIR48]|nr:hypothetical protein [Bradyrhizobium sp. CIR18]MBB4429309.1 hypothetical protein [Bradyrhizobium sp. CIR48]
MIGLWFIGSVLLLIAAAVLGLLAIVVKGQQHDPGIE